ncbi:DUF1214 domain-containing protein [Methylocella silvestris]|uniref:DUF1214 domain-containing protein n=1 Tax=Methylocella silvestris TaxID=199596 RepID=A0A2J7TIF0_METSI|nr:DUF1214 domain-containing protein [Methylocella silvestris]PNG26545.1 hypothetical protein CR492_07585 [Methylocella silvestris]
MILIGKFILAALVGALIGLGLTSAALQNDFGFGAVTAGPWTAWPRNGGRGVDPYARAMLAKSGEIPLGSSEGLSFIARADSGGRRLEPGCDYIVSGPTPQARYWTLTVMTPQGKLLANPSGRSGFTSSEILRAADGSFAIALSRRARPGNWIPLAENDPFILDLRLYESEFSTSMLAFDAANLPTIAREVCR